MVRDINERACGSDICNGIMDLVNTGIEKAARRTSKRGYLGLSRTRV